MSAQQSVLYDALGPKGKRNVRIGTVVGIGLILVLVPQTIRRVLPAIISQLVTLLKGPSLGFTIGYSELLRAGRGFVEFDTSKFGLPIYVAAVLFYIAVNLSLSTFARWLDKRSTRTKKVAEKSEDNPMTDKPLLGELD